MARYINKLYRSSTGQAVLLFLYLFLVVTSYVSGKVSRDALFLGQFNAVQLPYADIAIAVLVGFVIAGYVRIGRYFRLDTLLIMSLAAYVVSSVFFWWVGTHYHFAWLYPLVYVWIGVFGVLATAQVWTLANYIFTTREAKSSFSIVGSGAICGWIAGGYISKTTAGHFGAESLLLVIAGGLSIAIGLVVLIWRGRRPQTDVELGSVQQQHPSLTSKFRELCSTPHLRTIAILICLSSFATTTAGWQFKAMAKQSIHSTAGLAAFFGEFNFYAGILSLIVQLTLTSKLLKRFGIGPMLLVVPLALLMGSAGILIFGTLATAVLLKGFDQVFRYSVDKSSVELLYLPVPFATKVQAKSFIDTVVWRMGDGLAGVGVLIASNYFHATPRTVGWVTLTAVMFWAAVALAARKTYVASLQTIVQGLRPHTKKAGGAVPEMAFAKLQANPNFNRAKVEAILAIEIAQHYRSYQVMQEMTEITPSFPKRVAELQLGMKLEADRIFRLLAILYPNSDLDSTYAAIRSGVPTMRDSALELMENTLDSQLHRLLVPLFDDTLSVGKRAHIAAKLLGEEVGETKQVVWALIQSDNPWLRRSGTLAMETMEAA